MNEKLINLNYIEPGDDISIGQYIQARIEHIIDDLEVLANKYNLKDTEQYDTIQYQAMQILKHLELD